MRAGFHFHESPSPGTNFRPAVLVIDDRPRFIDVRPRFINEQLLAAC
jgi:hypothetical protein